MIPVTDSGPQPPGRLIAPTSRPRSPIARPGITERLLVILALFVFYHQTPNAWFVRAIDLGPDYSNPQTVAVTLLLIMVSVIRIVGYFDLLIALVKLEPAVFLFVALALASVVWSANPAESLRRAIMFAAVSVFAGYLVLRFSLAEIIVMMALMVSFSAGLNLAFVSARPFYAIDEFGNWSGVFSQKNSLGYVAALGMPTLLIAARIGRRLRLLFYSAFGIQGLLLYQSDSRTMWIAAAAAVALLPLYNGFRALRTLRGAVILGLGGSAAFMIAFITAAIGPLTAWLDKDVSLTGRIPLWESLMPVIGERLLLGHGYHAAFGGYFSPIHEVWLQNPWEPGDAHNAILQIWVELGLAGVVLFLVSYVRAVSRSIRIVAIVPGAVGLWPVGILTSALLMAVTESGIQSDPMGWTIYLVAVLSVSGHLKYRHSIGLSNDLSRAMVANKLKLPSR